MQMTMFGKNGKQMTDSRYGHQQRHQKKNNENETVPDHDLPFSLRECRSARFMNLRGKQPIFYGTHSKMEEV